MATRGKLNKNLAEELQDFFCRAITQNDFASIKRLLTHQKHFIDINAWNGNGISPIHQCCMEGSTEALSLLIKAGADINKTDPEGWSSLHAASASGNVEICQYLIQKNANVLARTVNNELPIDLSDNVTITYILAKQMIDLGYNLLAKKYLIHINDSLSDIYNHKKSTGLKSILKSSSRHNYSLERMSSTSSSSSYYSTSSSSCEDSELDDSRTIEKSKRSVKFSVKTLFKHFLQENDSIQLANLLDSNKCNIINKLDRRGLTPLHFATINGFTESIEVLHHHGVDVNQQDPNGWTALHAAVVTSDINSIFTLLGMKSNIFAVTNKGQSVFELTDNQEVLNILNNYLEDSCNNNLKRTTSI